MPNSNLSIEYIAGFFDGEGSITITKPSKTMPTHNLYVSIGQINRSILEEIQKIYGGYISTDNRRDSKHINDFYQLVLKCKDAERFLRAIYSFVVLKREQIDIAFKLRETQRIHRGKYHPLPSCIVEIREKLRLELMCLRTNSKGGKR